MALTTGDIVRVKTTKQEGIVGILDGNTALVMFKYSRAWMKTTAIEQPAGGGNVAAQDVKKWLDAR